MISELAARSTIPICGSLPGLRRLRLLRLGPNCFALSLPPTAEFGNQPVYIIIANILG